MAVMNFGGVEENVVTRDEFPLSKAKEVLKDEVIAVIGYGCSRTRTIAQLARQRVQCYRWTTKKQ